MRKNIWETDSRFHCSLIGVCLAVSEQRKLLKKSKYRIHALSDPDCHGILVSQLANDTPLVRRVQKYLDGKYTEEIAYWNDLGSSQYLRQWVRLLEKENSGGNLYGLITQPDIPENQIDKIAGSIHILSYYKMHQMACLRQKIRQLSQAKESLEEISMEWKKRWSTVNKALKEKEELSRKEEKRIERLNADNEQLKQYLGNAEKLHRENMELREKVTRQANQIHVLYEKAESHKNNCEIYLLELERQKDINQTLSAELKLLLNEFIPKEEECLVCPQLSLCQRRILLVGGITKLKSYYQEVVKKYNGIFEYHDGYLKNGDQSLAELVQKSDIVLCPVDVNSHRACLSVKRFCKKWRKPYHMLTSSSVSSISRELTEISQNICN